MPLLRTSFAVGALGCNCSIVACPETNEALVKHIRLEKAGFVDARVDAQQGWFTFVARKP